MRIIASVGQKGGIGKSTAVMNVAAVLARDNRVLVVDVDPQQSTTWWAGNAEDTLPFDFTADVDPNNLAKLRSLDYDVVIVDTPGSLQDTAILQVVLDNADFAIVPLTPDDLSVKPLVRTINEHIKPRAVPYRVLLSKIDQRNAGELEDWQALVDQLGLPRFRQAIRQYKAHKDAPSRGEVVTNYTATRANRNAIHDFDQVALELVSIWSRESSEEKKSEEK